MASKRPTDEWIAEFLCKCKKGGVPLSLISTFMMMFICHQMGIDPDQVRDEADDGVVAAKFKTKADQIATMAFMLEREINQDDAIVH